MWKNDFFWPEIGSGFGELGGTPPPRIPRRKPQVVSQAQVKWVLKLEWGSWSRVPTPFSPKSRIRLVFSSISRISLFLFLYSRLRDRNGCAARTVSLSVYCHPNDIQSSTSWLKNEIQLFPNKFIQAKLITCAAWYKNPKTQWKIWERIPQPMQSLNLWGQKVKYQSIDK